jgi:chromatin remodeling complex protein RSC6
MKGKMIMPTSKKSSTKKTTAGKTASKTSKKRSTGTRSTGAKRAPNQAFMREMQPSTELAAIVGSKPIPRTEITKKVWDYIKRNNLQDSKNKRMINADDKLRPVLGGKKQVSMFEMTKLVNQHLKEAR